MNPGAYWTRGKFSVNLRENVYGKTSEIVSTDGTGNNGTKAKIPTTGITDIETRPIAPWTSGRTPLPAPNPPAGRHLASARMPIHSPSGRRNN